MSTCKFGWFSSGTGPTSRNLLTAAVENIESGAITGRIEFVFCNREPGESPETDSFIELVEDFGIPLVCFSYAKFRAAQDALARDKSGKLAPWRLDYDREVMERLRPFSTDINVLAGYMLITTPELCRRYRMINLHSAAPGGPTGTWRQVIWRLIAEKAERSGVLINLVTPELERGPLISYCTYAITGGLFDEYWAAVERRLVEEIENGEGESNPLFSLIRREGVKREIPLLVETLKLFGSGLVRVTGTGLVVDTEDYPVAGYDLTEKVEAGLRAGG